MLTLSCPAGAKILAIGPSPNPTLFVMIGFLLLLGSFMRIGMAFIST